MANWTKWIAQAVGGQAPRSRTPSEAAESSAQAKAIRIAEIPDELRLFFELTADGRFAGDHRHELNLLSLSQAAETTSMLRCHPLLQAVGGIVLDDPDTSNHHVYCVDSPMRGAVLYLSHDGESRIVFSSIDEFLDAASRTRQHGGFLSDQHPVCSPMAPDQAALTKLLEHHIQSGQDDDMVVALSLVPSWDLLDRALLERLATHSDFLAAEALAMEIAKRPAAHLLSAAQLCRQHGHPQVAEAGAHAVKVILGR